MNQGGATSAWLFVGGPTLRVDGRYAGDLPLSTVVLSLTTLITAPWEGTSSVGGALACSTTRYTSANVDGVDVESYEQSTSRLGQYWS